MASSCCGGKALNFSPVTKPQVISLYRSLLRHSKKIPTPHKSRYVFEKVKFEFRTNRTETNPEDVSFNYRYGLTNLDTIKVQSEVLTKEDGMVDLSKIPKPKAPIEFTSEDIFKDNFYQEKIEENRKLEEDNSIIKKIAREDQDLVDSVSKRNAKLLNE